MNTSNVRYLGNLRTRATHLRSGESIITDAPVDNYGKGEAFSPTDLVAAATASCMVTTMGIVANRHGIDLGEIDVDVIKVMADNPRRIAEIHTHLRIPDEGLTDAQKTLLENTAKTCPVVVSLAAEIKKVISFEYV